MIFLSRQSWKIREVEEANCPLAFDNGQFAPVTSKEHGFF